MQSPVQVATAVGLLKECRVNEVSGTALSLLEVRIQEKEGTWVECDQCHKWRYVAKIVDPCELASRSFNCADVKKNCTQPSDKGWNTLSFYQVSFFTGSLVWARRGPDMFWPAMIEDASDNVSQYFLIGQQSSMPIGYHVTFLDTLRSGGWIRSHLLVPFTGTAEDVAKYRNLRGPGGPKIDRQFQEAVERARNASVYQVHQRLELFSFLAHVGRQRGILRENRDADVIANGMDVGKVVSRKRRDGDGSNVGRNGTLISFH